MCWLIPNHLMLKPEIGKFKDVEYTLKKIEHDKMRIKVSDNVL